MLSDNIFHMQFAIDTFFLLICGTLVMWMAAGFAMLEAGLVRAKNTTEILTKNIALYAISCLAYLIIGYRIMYGGDIFLFGIHEINTQSIISNLLKTNESISQDAIYSPAADFFFQVVFVATTMSIVSGAVAERMKLWAFLIFNFIFTAFIYPMEGSWIWGNNDVLGLYSLSELGFSDFAGSGVVHLAGASAALSGVILLGARKGKYNKNGSINAIPGANLPLATLGTFILWMGWFGFNGGSVLKLSDITSSHSIALVFINTNAAAAAGTLSALIFAKIIFKKADLTMILNGALAGLVIITAEPLTPSPLQAICFGIIAGVLVICSILILDKLHIDDPVGAISVHGFIGFIGLLLVPISNNSTTIIGQLCGAITIFLWVFITSSIVWYLLKRLIGIRISSQDEYDGADISDCGMEAYPEFTRNK